MQLLSKDPYRLLFPVALLNFVLGLAVWLPHLFGDSSSFPLIEHMQLLMRGTMYCFIIGFLLTMLPRNWAAPFVPFPILLVYTVGFLSFPVLLLLGQTAIFEYVVIGVLLLFAWDCLYRMFPRGRTPGKFVFAVCTTVVITVIANIGYGLGRIGFALPLWFSDWSHAIAMQGSILLFIFSIAPFLIKKFQGSGPCCEVQHARRSNIIPAVVISVFAATYLLSGDWSKLGIVLRTALLAVAFCEALPLWRWPSQQAWFIRGIWISMWCIIIGHTLPLFDSGHVIIWNHVMYITGFLQLCLMIGARVVCGHAQQLQRLEQHNGVVITIIVFLMMSVLSRIGVDWAPESRNLHLILAAFFAFLALGLWFISYGRLLCAQGGGKHA